MLLGQCAPTAAVQGAVRDRCCVGLQFSRGVSSVGKGDRCLLGPFPFSLREVSCALSQVSDHISQRSFKWGEIGVLISASLSTCSQV